MMGAVVYGGSGSCELVGEEDDEYENIEEED